MSASTHRNGSKIPSNQKHQACRRSRGIIYRGAITLIVVLSLEVATACCEAKEFDWAELGVQLANAKPPTLSGQAASNLRILVSPQRRMSKNYEFEYNNSSQTQPGHSEPSSYVLSSSHGTPFLTQSVYQLTPNQTIHSSAYSALSASLASLKSRLNARGVSLSSALGENGSQPTTSHLYSNPNGYASSSVLLDPSQQAAVQQQQQAAQQVVGQAPSQPTYLSVSSQQEQQGASGYTVPPSQSNDNKTIVLAIPAKINFLSGAKQQAQHQTSQAQQLNVLQATGEQQVRPEYATKQQLGVLNADGSLDTSAQAGAEQQEHHQYVIVNQPAQLSAGDHHSHSVAANLSPSSVSANGQVYSTIYQTGPSASASQLGGYAVKYVPAYTSQQAAGPLQQQQPAAIQKVYSVIEAASATGQQQLQQSPLPQVQPSYEAQLMEQAAPAMGTRYLSCLDTCNSADPRWRKYTVSKYKACCSRSSQYDAAFEQPSADKVGETSSRYNDDAYYNYLYRRSRARRSRRLRSGRNYYGSPAGRYYGNSASALASSSAAGAQAEDDSQAPEQPQKQHQQQLQAGEGARSNGGRSSAAYYSSQEYPLHGKQQYRSAYRGGYGSGPGSAGSASLQDSPLDSTGRGSDEPSSSSNSKYSATKERAYRRSRSRELEPLAEPQGPLNENPDDEAVYSRAGSYGNNDYSVDAQGRYSAILGGPGGDDDDQTRFDEPTELEPVGGKADEYSLDGADASGSDDAEIDVLSSGPAYKYSSGLRARGKKAQLKSRQQQRPLGAPASRSAELSKYYKKSARKNKYASKSSNEQHHNANGTDYESAQPGEHNQDSQANGSTNGADQDDQSSYSNKSSQSPYEQSDSDKEAILAKYRASLNETTVANLSKTTMHLKEILSILEKKAHLRSNETAGAQQAPASPQGQQQQSLPVTSTPAPITTTSLYPPFSSLLGGSSYSSPLSSDFLASDFSLKSPYRFEPSSLTSSLSSAAALSLPSSAYGSFGASDAFNPLTPPYPTHYGLHPGKHLGAPGGGPQRKRRPSKNGRYNDIMFQKAAHSLMNQPSLLNVASKNRFLSPAYYSALQYPYLYRGAGPTITNPYPYKNLHKNPYSSLLNGPVSSKLATSGQLYTDESRLHSLTGLDPLSNMASSLRPSAGMRLRNKPFVFQPQVLPIYTRHTILSPSLDVKA